MYECKYLDFRKKSTTTHISGQTKYFYWLLTAGSIRSHSLDKILLNLPPHRQLLQIHPGPSWHSFSWHGLGVHHHMETSGRSQCASGCPGGPQRRGCSPPACAHCQDRGCSRLFRITSYSRFDTFYQTGNLKQGYFHSFIAGFIDEEFLTPQKIWTYLSLIISLGIRYMTKWRVNYLIARGAIPHTLPDNHNLSGIVQTLGSRIVSGQCLLTRYTVLTPNWPCWNV